MVAAEPVSVTSAMTRIRPEQAGHERTSLVRIPAIVVTRIAAS
jgi:hypothetical protein